MPLLVVYGLVAATLGTIYLAGELPMPQVPDWPIQGHREDLIRESTAIIDEGGPPLLFESLNSREGDRGYLHVEVSGNFPGFFAFVPSLASWFDLEPLEGVKLLFLLSFFLPLAIYPLIFHRLTGSLLVALASPALLVSAVLAGNFAIDLYWIMAWVPLALLPLLLFAVTSPNRAGFVALLAAAFGASYASSIRGLTGLGILIGALLVLAFAFSHLSRARQALGAASIIVAFLSISFGGMTLADRAAQDYAGERLVADGSDIDVGRAHIAYMGLGYLPNEAGIVYLDSITLIHGRRIDPDLEFYGPGFADVARELYIEEVKSDPIGYANLTVTKAAVSAMLPGFNTMVFIGVAAGLLILIGPFARLTAWAILLSIPLFAIGFGPGLIGVPQPQFILGGVAAAGALEILLVMLLAAALFREAPRLVRRLQDEGGVNVGVPIAAVLLIALLIASIRLNHLGDLLIAAVAASIVLGLVAGTRGSVAQRFEQVRSFLARQWARAGEARGGRLRLTLAAALLIVVPLGMLGAERRSFGVSELAGAWAEQRILEINNSSTDERHPPPSALQVIKARYADEEPTSEDKSFEDAAEPAQSQSQR